MAPNGERNMIKKVGGDANVRRHLENLGFVPGAYVSLVAQISGNVIVNIKDSRVALSREMAAKIMV
jgi:ferrous iron transport protein A